MPFYEYTCGSCSADFTELRPMDERDRPAECPECGSTEVKRKLSAFAHVLGGSASTESCPLRSGRGQGGPGGHSCSSAGFS